MEPATPIFRPQYSLLYRLGFMAVPILFFAMLAYGIGAPRMQPTTYWYFTFTCGVLNAIAPFFCIREIRFAKDMVIRRYFLPDMFVKHNETYTIGSGMIQMNQRRIRLGPLENMEELKDISQRWAAKQALRARSTNEKKVGMGIPSRGTGAYAGFWGLVLGTIVAILQPPELNLDPRWLPGITFAVIYFLFVYIIPKL